MHSIVYSLAHTLCQKFCLAALLIFFSSTLIAADKFSVPVALDGVVTLQGRGSSGPSWVVTLNVEFYPEGSDVAVSSVNVQTNESGFFAIADAGIDPGNYVITIKNDHSLKIAYAAFLDEGSNSIGFGSLPEGDSNNDNGVTIVDFSLLSTSFGLSEGDTGYDARADYNDDGSITIQDFSLLSTNFGETGYTVTTTSYSELLAAQGGRSMFTTAPIPFYGNYINTPLNEINVDQVSLKTVNVKSADILTTTVLLETREQGIDAASIELDYNAERMKLISVEYPEALPLILENSKENGKVRFAAGALEDIPVGDVILLTLKFKANGDLSEGDITVNSDNTNATFAGRLILTDIDLAPIEKNQTLQIYPNPNDGLLHISGTNGLSENFELEIIDLQGNVLLSETRNPAVSDLTIDLNDIPTGVYILKVESDAFSAIQRIVKR